MLKDLVRLRTSLQPYLQAELGKLSDEGRPFNRPLNYDFPEDAKTWELAEQGLGQQNEEVAADRKPQMGDVITTVPCAQAPKWSVVPVDSSNTTAGAPSTLRLKSNPSLCLDSATLSTQCGPDRQCGAALWECLDEPPAAHTWSHRADLTLRNMRDAGFVGAQGGAESGGEHCLKLTSSGSKATPFPVEFPTAAGCSASDKEMQWTLKDDGAIANAAHSGLCLATAPPRTVVGVDQYMVGDSMMAAPVLVAGARERKVYFPSGARWQHHFTGHVYDGGSIETVAAPLDTFPLFHRQPDSPDANAITAPDGPTFYAATDPLIRIVGRTARTGGNTTLYFDWPSVYIEVEAVGPLSILLTERWQHGNEYSISLNGVASAQLNTTNASSEHAILKQGESGHVRIEKVTEGRQDIGGLVAFHGLKAGQLKPLQKKPSGRRIECIGDSAMVGNHAERWYPYPDDCPTTRGTPESRESSRLSWCTKVAQTLDADYEMIGESGNGLIMTDGAKCHSVGGPDTCIPAKWKQRLSCANKREGDRACLGLGGDAPLDTTFAPQAVLINLGGNDYGKPPKCPTTAQ